MNYTQECIIQMFLNKDSVEKYIYIPTNSSFNEVVDILSENGLPINSSSLYGLQNKRNIMLILNQEDIE